MMEFFASSLVRWRIPTLVLTAGLYFLLMALLSAYVMNYLYLAVLACRHNRSPARPNQSPPGHWPQVTVQLPVYNEFYVVERLLEAVAALDYPPDRLQVQVLDDSTDETRRVIATHIKRLHARGLNIVHLHRRTRTGFKAGALAAGLARARGEFIAIFDADFVPAPDFLKRMLPHFENERVAFVQARWEHLNGDYSSLAILQALSLDAHFAIDQLARSRAGYFFNFNGTAGIWRAAAIGDAGGWRSDTLTEDLDLSYRALLRGWQGRYAEDVAVPAELPVSFTAFRRQQHRWARGSVECAIRFLPQIWRLDVPLSRKLAGSLHLTAYFTHFLTLGLVLVFPLLLALAIQFPRLLDPIGFGLYLNLMFLVPTIYFAMGQHLLRHKWFLRLPLILLMGVLASGLMLNTVWAALQIVRRRAAPFERTPKYGILKRGQRWQEFRYRVGLDPVVVFELLLSILSLGTAALALQTHQLLILTYSLLFTLGLLYSSGSTILEVLSKSPRAWRR